MDKFKQYLQQHETGMEIDVPGEEIWTHIRGNSSGAEQKSFIRRYAVAASVLVLISTAILLLITNHKKDVTPGKIAGNGDPKKVDSSVPKNIADNSDSIEPKNVIPPINPTNHYVKVLPKKTRKKVIKDLPVPNEITMIGDGYTRLIERQIRKVRATPVYAESPGYFTQFAIQLKQMETDEVTLKQDIKSYGFNDQLLEQLINIYQQKLNLLKSLQGEINKMNNRVKANQYASGNTEPYFIKL